jgi:hypothetical protein
MKNSTKATICVGALAMITLFIVCSTETEKPKEVKRNFEITILGKKVTVTDTRTGENDQDLEQMGIFAKLEGAALALDGVAANTNFNLEAFNRVLDRGMIIIIEKLAVNYNYTKTNGDGKTIWFDIDNINTLTVNFLADSIYGITINELATVTNAKAITPAHDNGHG